MDSVRLWPRTVRRKSAGRPLAVLTAAWSVVSAQVGDAVSRFADRRVVSPQATARTSAKPPKIGNKRLRPGRGSLVAMGRKGKGSETGGAKPAADRSAVLGGTVVTRLNI